MKMAKANEADLDMAMELSGAIDALTGWNGIVPAAIEELADGEEAEQFDRDNLYQCQRVLGYLLDLADRASLMRVVWGAAVMLAPENELVDPDADTIEHHPKRQQLEKECAELRAKVQELEREYEQYMMAQSESKDQYERTIADLRAWKEAAENAEPAFWAWQFDDGFFDEDAYSRKRRAEQRNTGSSGKAVPLYTRPSPQVPEGWRLAPSKMTESIRQALEDIHADSVHYRSYEAMWEALFESLRKDSTSAQQPEEKGGA